MFRSLSAYAISASFKQGISHFYSASYGSIQVALKKLFEKGYISFVEGIENGRNKKVYSICDSGKAHFFQWMKTPIERRNNNSIISAKVYFLGLISDKEEKTAILEDILSIYKSQIDELLSIKEETSKIEMDAADQEIFKYQMKSLEHGLAEYEASHEFYSKMLEDFTL